MRFRLVFGALLILCLSACQQRQGEWTAFVYASSDGAKGVGGRPIAIEGLRSLRECRAAAERELRDLRDPGQGVFECGRDCAWAESAQQNICRETRR
jgi:hypothetical protein